MINITVFYITFIITLKLTKFIFTLFKRFENADNLLSSTKFSQVMSNTHRKGFGATAFKSKDAPPYT